MRKLGCLVLCSILYACGDDGGNEVAEIGWSFNYKDYTDSSTNPPPADDIRNCANQPANGVGPAYSAVAKVRVLIEDPEGQVPGIDHEYDCEQGMGGKRVPIRGLVKQLYGLTIEAKSAAGAVLYRYTEAEYDLTSLNSSTYVMPTATGELHFFPTYQGSLICPSTVTAMRYNLFKVTTAGTDTTAAVSGTATPACEQGMGGLESSELYIREIPVAVEAGTYQTYNTYKLRLEALDAGNSVTHCVTNSGRTVRPGDHSMGGNESLSPGSSCP